MKNTLRKIMALGILLSLAACSATLPVEYTPQSFATLPASKASMGNFTYLPAETGKFRPNQLQNTAAGQILIGEDVAAFVRRATALELQKAGADLNGGSRIVTGDVVEFKVDDLGYSVDWTYRIRYNVLRASDNAPVFSQTYTSKPRRTGKFGQPSDYTSTVNLMILDSVEQFMADVRRQRLF